MWWIAWFRAIQRHLFCVIVLRMRMIKKKNLLGNTLNGWGIWTYYIAVSYKTPPNLIDQVGWMQFTPWLKTTMFTNKHTNFQILSCVAWIYISVGVWMAPCLHQFSWKDLKLIGRHCSSTLLFFSFSTDQFEKWTLIVDAVCCNCVYLVDTRCSIKARDSLVLLISACQMHLYTCW